MHYMNGFSPTDRRNSVVRVLLVEHEDAHAALFRRMLAEFRGVRFELHEAPRLASALGFLEGNPVDVVLLDINLPDSNGVATVVDMALRSRVPVIVVTSLDDRAVAVNALRLGATDYLVKGCLDTALLGKAILRHVPERSRSRKTAPSAVQ